MALFELDGTRVTTPGKGRYWVAPNAVVLGNAVRGILPVARRGARTWAPQAAVADLRRRLARAHPGFDAP